MSEEAAISPAAARLPALDFAHGVWFWPCYCRRCPGCAGHFSCSPSHPEPGGPWDDTSSRRCFFLRSQNPAAVRRHFRHRYRPPGPAAWRPGQAISKVYFLRMVVLFLFGVVNALLFWWGDLLTVYAIVGLHAWCFCFSEPIIERLCFIAAS